MIFRVRNREAALQFEAHLTKHGFGTKILPEALDWHFAGVWDHLLGEFDRYSSADLEALWPKTGIMLRSSICLNIPVLMDDATIEKLVKAIISGAAVIG